MNHPKISAILPCYNHAHYLEERISTVLAQSLPVSEIIFLDDASTDDSLKLAKKLLKNAPVEVSFYSNTCNSGSPFSQWNKGFKLVRYPYVWIAETDDACEPSLLEELYSRIKNPNTVISFSQSRYIDCNGNELASALAYTDVFFPGFFADDFVLSGLEFNSRFMAVVNALPNASAVLFKTRTLESAGFANESMRFCGDWDFWVRIAEQGNVAFVAEELNQFRCHQATTRAKHHTPQARAEFLACRLRAQLGSQRSNNRLNLPRLMTLLFREKSQAMVISVNSVDWHVLFQVLRSYRLIANVPSIDPAAWSVIGIISLRKYIFSKCTAFKQRISLFVTRFVHSIC